MKVPSPKIRLNLDLSPRAKERIEDLRTRSDAESLVEVVRRALALYDKLLTIDEKEGKIIFENPDGTQERLHILF